MPIFTKWYEKKKPTFQISVLTSIAQNYKMSKSGVKKELSANYSDVTDAFKALQQHRFIYRTNRPNFKKKGKAEIFFAITYKGLIAYIAECNEPDRFWQAAINYCIQCGMAEGEFEDLYNDFILRYVGRTLDNSYSFSNFYFFDETLRRYYNVDKSDSPLTNRLRLNSQKILELLIFERPLSTQEIVDKTKLPEEDVKSVLKEYSLEQLSVNPDLKYTGNISKLIERYLQIMKHSMIVPQYEDTKETTYELSLFGVMLIIGTARVDTHFFRLLPPGEKIQLYDDYSLGMLLDNAAKNYADKLQFIFKKWNVINMALGKEGKSQLIYLFDPIVFGLERKEYFSLPVIEGGNKDLYDSINGLAAYTIRKLFKLYSDGKSKLKEFEDRDDFKPYRYLVESQLVQIESYLIYTDLKRFLFNFSEQIKQDQETTPVESRYLEELTIMEKRFAKEISIAFYIALNRRQPIGAQWNPEMSFLEVDAQPDLYHANDLLESILKSDAEIKHEFLTLMRDAKNYHEKTGETMAKLTVEYG